MSSPPAVRSSTPSLQGCVCCCSQRGPEAAEPQAMVPCGRVERHRRGKWAGHPAKEGTQIEQAAQASRYVQQADPEGPGSAALSAGARLGLGLEGSL